MAILKGEQTGALRDIINSAFNYSTLKESLEIRLHGFRYTDYTTSGDTLKSQIYSIVKGLDDEDRIDELILALTAERPRNKELSKFSYAVGILFNVYRDKPEITLSPGGLQALVNNINFSDPLDIELGISTNKRCVCKIELKSENGKTLTGTGFLVGPDRILTNYHVMEPAIKNPVLFSSVNCKFDFEQSVTAKILNPGKDYALDEAQPVLAQSEYDNMDLTGTPDVNVNWPSDKLDYALLKLETDAGNKPFGLNANNATSENRGWIKPSQRQANLFPESHIIIFQHPNGEPLKIAFGFQKILGTDANSLRVRYDLNTMKGSSGSPCFDENFNWIALHNSGDPDWNPKYNQGIPAKKIIDDLDKKGQTLS